MSLFEIFVIAVSLAMDAMAVSASNGLALKKAGIKHACIFGLYFGGFQCLMPIIGFFCGIGFGGYIEMIDHWIAFGLLSVIGGKMIYESLKNDDDGEENIRSDEEKIMSPQNLVMLAVATSIDALAVGVSFALTKNVNIWLSAAIIGIVAFALSFVGVLGGKQIGGKFEKHAALIGGIVLIIIGSRILITDLFF
ncbi:MAG: manganese efflux pump [Firmicutes bacterium]|nr:manganese efflux pump [Bacillota bacterium]